MRRVGQDKKKEPKVVAPVVQPKPVQPKHDVMPKVMMEATLALTEVASRAIDNPQLTQLITMLSQEKTAEPKTNKRLTVNRDMNGLIESIDIEEL